MPERDETPGGDMIVGGDATGFANNVKDNSTNFASTIRGLKKFDGRNPAELKGWMKKLCVVLGAQRKDIFPLLKGDPRPSGPDSMVNTKYTRANEDLYAILYLLVDLPAALSIQQHEHDNEISGDGRSAFETPVRTTTRSPTR